MHLVLPVKRFRRGQFTIAFILDFNNVLDMGLDMNYFSLVTRFRYLALNSDLVLL